MEYLTLLYRRRWIILAVTILAGAAGVGLALMQKPIWISTAQLLPSESRNESPGLAGLAALAGFAVPQSTSQEAFYKDILLSNDFLDALLENRWKTAKDTARLMTMAEIYEVKVDSTDPSWREKFRQTMREFIRTQNVVDFDRDPTGLMTLTTTTVDPRLSYEMNAFLLDRLDTYNRLKKKTKTSEKKDLIETRLQEVDSSLKLAEERLKTFREKNVSVSTPPLMLEQQRLLREVEVNGAIYQELRKQFEITKIEIVDNTQIINVLEHPVIPAVPGKSKRRKLVMIVTMLGMFGSSAAVIAFEKLVSSRKAIVKAA